MLPPTEPTPLFMNRSQSRRLQETERPYPLSISLSLDYEVFAECETHEIKQEKDEDAAPHRANTSLPEDITKPTPPRNWEILPLPVPLSLSQYANVGIPTHISTTK